MKDFRGKTAVITGAASGIGHGIARYCAKKGMNIVLSDIEEKPLMETAAVLSSTGADVYPVITDVSSNKDIKNLAEKTVSFFGDVDLLINNAGVATGSSIWESSLKDCQWVIGVNIFGVINCIREFVPIMLNQKNKSHIVNTSSIAGLATYHPCALYQLTKHGIVALSEQLYNDLLIKKANIKVSVLCPGVVDTNIMDSERNRPSKYLNNIDHEITDNENEKIFREMIKSGMTAEEVAEILFQGIEDEKFYIFTHPEMKPLIQKRMDDILQEKAPFIPPMEPPK